MVIDEVLAMNKLTTNLLPILLVLVLSGCAGISATQETPPPDGYKEVRCTCLDGEGRYGTLFNYVKGDADHCKLTIYGDLQDNSSISCGDDGIKIKININSEQMPKLDNGVVFFD